MPGPITGGSTGGSGTLAVNSEIAFIRSTGNDGTGIVGDDTKPYLTIQGAADAQDGPDYYFDIGADCACGNLVLPTVDNLKVYVRGWGPTESVVGDVSTGGKRLTIYDLGMQSVGFGAINIIGANGTAAGVSDATDGADAGDLELYSVLAGTITIRSGDGGSSASATLNAGDAGHIGVFYAYRTTVADVVMQGGSGGNLTNNANTSKAGNGGGVGTGIGFYANCVASNVTCKCGSGGNAGTLGTGGDSGGAGSPSNGLEIHQSEVIGDVNLQATTGGTGGAGNGADADSDGTLNLILGAVGGLSHGNPSGVGMIAGAPYP